MKHGLLVIILISAIQLIPNNACCHVTRPATRACEVVDNMERLSRLSCEELSSLLLENDMPVEVVESFKGKCFYFK